jgi:hypothetical protein
MILAMDIRRNGSADGDVLGPGRNGKKKSSRQDVVENFRDAGGGLAFDYARIFVKLKNPILPLRE